MPSTKVQRIMTQPIVRAVLHCGGHSLGGCALHEGARVRLSWGSHPLLLTRLLSCSQNLIFRFLQSKQRICIWLYENTTLRIEGRIIVRHAVPPNTPASRSHPWPPQGFDEYMNLVLDDAEEVLIKKKSRKPLGELSTPKPTQHDNTASSSCACASPCEQGALC